MDLAPKHAEAIARNPLSATKAINTSNRIYLKPNMNEVRPLQYCYADSTILVDEQNMEFLLFFQVTQEIVN